MVYVDQDRCLSLSRAGDPVELLRQLMTNIVIRWKSIGFLCEMQHLCCLGGAFSPLLPMKVAVVSIYPKEFGEYASRTDCRLKKGS